MEDDPTTESEWKVRAGAPIRLYELLILPLLLLGLAAIDIFPAMSASSNGSPAYSIVAVSVLVAAAVGLWVFGYLAYRDLTSRAVQRYFAVVVVSISVAGVLLSFGYFGLVPLFFAGRLTADRRFRRVRLWSATMPRRLWRRTAIAATVIGAVCLLLLPLARELGSLPLIAAAMAGRIVAPFVLGLATRFQSSVQARI